MSFIGIDVAKAHLEFAVRPTTPTCRLHLRVRRQRPPTDEQPFR
jgi:hypothetical protein